MTGKEGFRNPPQQLRSQRLVELLIDTTARLLITGGPAALSTNAVADEAGISVGSLYRYFPHKEALVAAVVEREGRRFHDRIRSLPNDLMGSTAAHRIAHVVAITARAYRSVVADDGLQSIELRQGGLFDRRHGALTAVVAELADTAGEIDIEEAQALQDAAPILAEIIVALIEAATARRVTGLSAETVVETASDAACAYLALVLAKRAAAV